MMRFKLPHWWTAWLMWLMSGWLIACSQPAAPTPIPPTAPPIPMRITEAQPTPTLLPPSPTPTREPSATPTSTPRPATPTTAPSPSPLPPTPTPALPTPTQAPAPPPVQDTVRLYESEITLPTYPWQDFVTQAWDETTRWPYLRFSRDAYEASHPQPIPRTYQLINLENRWLRVNVLPELGGRIYQCIFKPTGHNAFYQNSVIKPSPWGPEITGGGWLAVGGVEWGLPVAEHGYAWGMPWGHITLPGDTQRITLFDANQDSLHLSVTVGLSPDTAAFELHVELVNQSDQPLPLQFWLDAMTAPGPANTVGPDVRFLFPITQATVHSTGDPTLPQPGGVFDWPQYQGRDLSRLGNWGPWLGFFAYPQARQNWAAIYDEATDEGLVRVFPADVVPGLKGFGFGWSQPLNPDKYTDDGSAYVELQGGLTPTYDEVRILQPGEMVAWDEVWYPVVGMQGITHADALGALHLQPTDQGWQMRVMAVQPLSGQVTITDATGQAWTQAVQLAPDAPVTLSLPSMQLPLRFHLQSPAVDWEVDHVGE